MPYEECVVERCKPSVHRQESKRSEAVAHEDPCIKLQDDPSNLPHHWL